MNTCEDDAHDVTHRNVLSEAVATTAYCRAEACVYDEHRLTTKAAKSIHRFERDVLLWAVRHVTHDARLLEVGCGTPRYKMTALGR